MNQQIEASSGAAIMPIPRLSRSRRSRSTTSGRRPASAAALLAQQGIELSQATAAVTWGGKAYQAGSWVIPMHQLFVGLIQRLFERQKYPDAVLTGKGGSATELPYDTTGWTLPLQFGVAADPITASLPVGLAASSGQGDNVGGVSGEGAAFAESAGQCENKDMQAGA